MARSEADKAVRPKRKRPRGGRPTPTTAQPSVKAGDEALPSEDPGQDEQQRRAADRARRALEGDAADAGASGRE